MDHMKQQLDTMPEPPTFETTTKFSASYGNGLATIQIIQRRKETTAAEHGDVPTQILVDLCEYKEGGGLNPDPVIAHMAKGKNVEEAFGKLSGEIDAIRGVVARAWQGLLK